MPSASPFFPLLLITILAAVVPVLVSRFRFFRIPIVVAEILAGMLIGRSGLNWVTGSPTLGFLAEFGFALLMFLSGLEVDFQALLYPPRRANGQSRWQQPLPLAIGMFGGTLILAMGLGIVLSRLGLARNAILLGLILSTTSLGVVVPILKERNLTREVYGQVILVAALLSDFVTLVVFSFVIAVIQRGLTLDLLLFLLLLGAFLTAARIGRQMFRMPQLIRIVEELSHATAQMQVRGALALMVIFVMLADSLGVEIILGAFLAGAIIRLSTPGSEGTLRDKLDALGYGFFIPIFFITVGAEFDLQAVINSPKALLLLGVLFAAAYLVKVLPALLFRFRFGWRQSLAAGALLSSRLSLIIAASAIALGLGSIDNTINSAIILLAIATVTISPLLFNRLLPTRLPEVRKGVVILGSDQLAGVLGQRLAATGEQVRFVADENPERQSLAHLGYEIAVGDPGHPQTLEKAGLGKAQALIAASGRSETIVTVCRLALEKFTVPNVIARADDPQLLRQLQAMGVRVVQSGLALALALEGALRFPAAFTSLVEKGDEFDLLDVQLRNPRLMGKALRHIQLPGQALVLGIKRREGVVVPHGDTTLAKGDILMLAGSPDSLQMASGFLSEI
jgi:Kef-type K+ transport system membrane component KefB/Trk K+ transport system NAD-binding subunit